MLSANYQILGTDHFSFSFIVQTRNNMLLQYWSMYMYVRPSVQSHDIVCVDFKIPNVFSQFHDMFMAIGRLNLSSPSWGMCGVSMRAVCRSMHSCWTSRLLTLKSWRDSSGTLPMAPDSIKLTHPSLRYASYNLVRALILHCIMVLHCVMCIVWCYTMLHGVICAHAVWWRQ